AAYVLPLPHRLSAELEARLGIQDFDLTARRSDVLGTAGVGGLGALRGARAALSLAIIPMLAIVAGASVDGSFVQHDTEHVSYCAPVCGPPIAESWKVGGAAFGADVGLRLLLR